MENSVNGAYILQSLQIACGRQYPVEAKTISGKTRGEWRAVSTSRDDAANSKVSNAAYENESHESIFHTAENSISYYGLPMNQ